MDDRLLKLLVDLRYALGDNGARTQGDLVEYAKQIKAKADEADALREALVLTQSRLVPLSSVVVGLHGDGMYFSIGNQYFRLAYAPTEPAEFDFMRCMLLSAFSRLVEGAPAPQAHVGPDASGADGGMPGSAAERHLRRLLCLRAGMALTYWDDGEAQGTEHGISIDFMREPVADIDAKLCALNVARAARPSSPEPDEPEGSVCARCGALAFDPVVAQQAEPDHETRAELAEQQVVQLAEERDHYRNLWQKAQQANHLTIERLRDALVASRIIDPAAVEDPDGYDDGVTLHRIGALHWRLT